MQIIKKTAPSSQASANSGRRQVSDGLAAWLCASFLCILLSVAGVVNHALGFPLSSMSRPVTKFLDYFIEPGYTVWWVTTGNLFAGYPSSASGYAITIGANVVAWLLTGALFSAIARFIWRHLASLIANQKSDK